MGTESTVSGAIKLIHCSGSRKSSVMMQKSKSSSNVIHQGGRMVAKKIFRSRSKSQTRAPLGLASCTWAPQGNCIWSNLSGKQVLLTDTNLIQLTEIERKVLQKVALAKLQALSLGVSVKIPVDSGSTATLIKPKRRPYLLKRKAISANIFDAARKEAEKDSTSPSNGLVFGIPLAQCVENDRISRAAANTNFPLNSGDISSEESSPGCGSRMNRNTSRSSFSSLTEHSGSTENIMLRDRMAGSVPHLLDTIGYSGSSSDLQIAAEEEPSVPRIMANCINYLERHGLKTLGIFRVSTSRKRIRQLREDFDCGKDVRLDDEQSPHDVATLLKEYLRDLPDPLLCRDLYQAFVHTQRIRNRRLQFEALQHLIQLLPTCNRDTLFTLLEFLSLVAHNSLDSTTGSGDIILGNKMDSSNLATVFAPNILHSFKPGKEKESNAPEKAEDRIDVINVIRSLIDHHKELFIVSADLLDEVYLHMIDAHPEALEMLLNRKECIAYESVDELDSETSSSVHWTETQTAVSEVSRKMYSREDFLHESAATGGPNVSMRIKHKDKIRRKRDEVSVFRTMRTSEETSSSSVASSSVLRIRSDPLPYQKVRSASLEGSGGPMDSQQQPYCLDGGGILSATFSIPLNQADVQQPLNVENIPYIEDNVSGNVGAESHQLTIGMLRRGLPAAPPRRRPRSNSGSDSSAASIGRGQSHISGGDSAYSTVHTSPVSDITTASPLSSWAASPPISPDHISQVLPQSGNSKTTSTSKSQTTVTLGRSHGEHYTPSISSIGGEVLRSKTAEFEQRMTEKKKYTKRRYTDSRHQTTLIPDATTLAAAIGKSPAQDASEPNNSNSTRPTIEERRQSQTSTTGRSSQVYKRREIISSVPLK